MILMLIVFILQLAIAVGAVLFLGYVTSYLLGVVVPGILFSTAQGACLLLLVLTIMMCVSFIERLFGGVEVTKE